MKQALLIVALALFQLQATSQKYYSFKHYTTKDGLINNTIFSINQDKQGYLWFATDGGVSKFDGYRFDNSVLPAINRSESYSQYIEKDKKGNLVIAGFMQGIFVEQPNGSYQQFMRRKKQVGKNVVRNMKACADGSLLVSEGRHLWRFEKDSFQLVYDCEIDNNAFQTVECDNDGNIWFGGFMGLGILPKGEKTPAYLPEFKDHFIVKILFVSPNVLAVGTKSGYYLVTIHNNKPIDNRFEITQPIEQLRDVFINHIYQDNEQNIWISTAANGVFKTANNQLIENISLANGLPSQGVMCTFRDSENNYWFGTEEGVCQLNSFNDYSFSYNNKQISGIEAMHTDAYGRIWFNIDQKLYWLANDVVHLADVNNEIIEDEYIQTIDIQQNTLYLFTNNALFSMPLNDIKRKMVIKKVVDFNAAQGLYCTYFETPHKLWLGFENGIYLFENNQLSKCEFSSATPIRLRPAAIVKDPFGYYWIGDYGYGLYRTKAIINEKDRSITLDSILTFKSLKPDSAFVTAWVQDMDIDTKGNLWLSTLYTGVYKLTLSPQGVSKSHLYNIDNGLSSNNVSGILADKQSRIWLSTTNGANCIDMTDSIAKIHHYNNQNQSRSVYGILPTQTVTYISYAEGLYAVQNQSANSDDESLPAVRISNIQIMGLSDSTLLLNQSASHQLAFDRNFIAFDFTAISFCHDNNTEYQYMLEGIDNTWSNYTQRRYASYSALPPGNYRFLVRARWSKLGENGDTTSFNFKILPPFYRTWWFITLIILVIISILYAIYQYRIKQLIKIERMRTRIASDLHDDVGSTLSSISILSDLLESQIDNQQKSSEMVQRIGSNARNMLRSMDDIIWSVNPDNDRFRNLDLRIKEYAIPLFESKNIKFAITSSNELSNISLAMDVRRNIYLIAKETINNLIKYAQCSEATVTFTAENSDLIMTITDNGLGFDVEAVTSRNGLKNMKRRAEQIGGQLNIASEMEVGTTITLRIKTI